jgi:hypothetical protein
MSPSLRMGGYVPQASIAQGSHECYTTHSSLGYNGDMSVFRAHLSMLHSLEQSEVSMTIPINSEDPWMTTIISIELDDTVDHMAQVALASLCGSRLVDTAVTPIILFPFCFRGELVGQKRLEAVSDLKSPHYHIGRAALAEYAQYSFDL